MSFCEFVFSAGYIHKTVKVDLDVRINRSYLPWSGHQKTLEDTRGLHIEAEGETPLGGAGPTYRPVGP